MSYHFSYLLRTVDIFQIKFGIVSDKKVHGTVNLHLVAKRELQYVIYKNKQLNPHSCQSSNSFQIFILNTFLVNAMS